MNKDIKFHFQTYCYKFGMNLNKESILRIVKVEVLEVVLNCIVTLKYALEAKFVRNFLNFIWI